MLEFFLTMLPAPSAYHYMKSAINCY